MTEGTAIKLGLRRLPLRSWASLVKISHTVFAMPFALAMFVVVTRDYPATLLHLFWIVVALVSARTAAMAYNRYVDRDIDALNPRTIYRELPAGIISEQSVVWLVLLSSCLFIFSAFMLGQDCGSIAPFVLLVLLAYSHTKRFTAYAHVLLGLALALAPGGVWFAVTHSIDLLPLWLMCAVLFWVSGFDIIYSCLDVTFDKVRHLHSIPARFGVAKALWISRLFHLAALIMLIFFGVKAELGIWYFVGLAMFGLVISSQHFLISPDNLAKVNIAFFTRNGIASIIFFFGTALDVYLS